MNYFKKGSEDTVIKSEELKRYVWESLDKIGPRNKVLIVPPDFTRFHSRAGEITTYIYEYYGNAVSDILPALGTHAPMNAEELEIMFPGIPQKLFRVHDWRNDVITIGEIPGEKVKEITKGTIDYSWPAQLNKLIASGGHDLILSVGQVVPHEVMGMANYNKNLFVGTGGSEGINKSHFIGAAYGMEKVMGRADNPVRSVLNYASANFTNHLPIVYMHTVMSKNNEGNLVIRGLYIGSGEDVYTEAADLSLKVNFTMLDRPIKKAVVYLDPSEFKSTWLGNKAIYRTRMALADNAELIILAPGLKEFGEDSTIDSLIRKYGYNGTPATLKATNENKDLRDNLGAAAHLIHGSSEGRFSITYCPGNISKEEIEAVNFNYASLNDMMKKYPIENLNDGYNILSNGEEIYYISNPALGLWATRDKFV